MFEFILEDGTARLHCRWWNLPYMEKYFHAGDEVEDGEERRHVRRHAVMDRVGDVVDLVAPGGHDLHRGRQALQSGVEKRVASPLPQDT